MLRLEARCRIRDGLALALIMSADFLGLGERGSGHHFEPRGLPVEHRRGLVRARAGGFACARQSVRLRGDARSGGAEIVFRLAG